MEVDTNGDDAAPAVTDWPGRWNHLSKVFERRGPLNNSDSFQAWLPDGYSNIFRSYVFGPSGFWTMAPLRCAAKLDPFLSLDCAPTPSTLAQSKERKGSNFAIWQPWCRACSAREEVLMMFAQNKNRSAK